MALWGSKKWPFQFRQTKSQLNSSAGAFFPSAVTVPGKLSSNIPCMHNFIPTCGIELLESTLTQNESIKGDDHTRSYFWQFTEKLLPCARFYAKFKKTCSLPWRSQQLVRKTGKWIHFLASGKPSIKGHRGGWASWVNMGEGIQSRRDSTGAQPDTNFCKLC